jgi:hypothetical protein
MNIVIEKSNPAPPFCINARRTQLSLAPRLAQAVQMLAPISLFIAPNFSETVAGNNPETALAVHGCRRMIVMAARQRGYRKCQNIFVRPLAKTLARCAKPEISFPVAQAGDDSIFRQAIFNSKE